MKNKKNLDLEELLVQKLHALYDVENQLVKALPKLARIATSQSLKEVFRNHLTETRAHVHRIKQAYKSLYSKPKRLKVEAIRGIIKDTNWLMKNVQPAAALDSALVRAAQYAEHYEMAGYLGAIAWANTLGEKEVSKVLQKTLNEEIGADKNLEKVGRELDTAFLN
ncbi:MAG: DUF892 family protein [Candidatus Paceibacterota bacterium]